MPKIGMAGSSVMLMPALDALSLAIQHEYDAFEIFAEFPQCVASEMTARERDEGARLVKASGIALAVHAPFTSLNIAALNPGARRESVRQTIDAIDLCADLGGENVVVHDGEYVYRNKQAMELQWDYNIESLRQCAEHAERRGVRLCLENIGFEPEHTDRCANDLVRIANEVDREALWFCLDIGHARLNNELDDAIEKMGPRIRHIHFTDNDGVKDDHYVIGEGNFDYKPHLDFFRNFEHIMTLEVINVGTDPGKALASREYVKKLLAS